MFRSLFTLKNDTSILYVLYHSASDMFCMELNHSMRSVSSLEYSILELNKKYLYS